MIHLPRLFCFVALSACIGAPLALAQELTPRPSALPLDGDFVPAPLDDLANDDADLKAPAARVEIGKIPFDLIGKAGIDNLFLKEAGWPNWKTDPTKTTSPYDSRPDAATPQLPVTQIPVADYQAVYLLAATENDAAFSPVVTLRIGAKDASMRVDQRDFPVTVPRFNEKGGAGVVRTLKTARGNVFLMRVPLNEPFAQDFRERRSLDVEITKEVRLSINRPGPARFQLRPLGLPSGVHLFGLTFERAPLRMDVTSDAPGHVWNQPQTPTFDIELLRVGAQSFRGCRVQAEVTDFYGAKKTLAPIDVDFARTVQRRRVSLPIAVSKRGFHRLKISVYGGRKLDDLILTRETTFALLPPDTRKYRSEAPWGTADFGGGHYTPLDADFVGPLYVKAGLRYGMFKVLYTDADRARYGIVDGRDARVNPRRNGLDAAIAETKAGEPAPPRFLMFHENVISGRHILRAPDVFTGKTYVMNEEEKKQFAEMWDFARDNAQIVRKEFPGSEIYFGNGPIHLLEAFARNKFPAELLGSRGNEAGSFGRPPETQPLDFVANNASLYMDRKVLDFYGYKDTPLRQCHEICYPDTNPGNLSLNTQAAYYIRHIMHSMAWRIPIIRPGLMVDVGNSYYFSNWGASGFCFSQPDVSPKPSYVAIATLTQQLDGAQFSRMVPTNSPTTYAFEFRKKDGTFVTCLWTLRGQRELTLQTGGINGALTDMNANDQIVVFAGGGAKVTVSENPVFLATPQALRAITPGVATHEARPTGEKFLISPLDKLSDWQVEKDHDLEMELYNFQTPRRLGDFEWKEAKSFEGESGALSVRPKPVGGMRYLPMYNLLSHRQGVAIPGQPTEIGLMVNGNGGWGRIIWELEDAAEQRWVSIGAEQTGAPNDWMADWMSPEQFAKLRPTGGINDWNSDDGWGRSTINFEGWRYLKFPLPGNYPGEGYHWPMSGQWRCVKKSGEPGDGVVHYPLKFTKLAVTFPSFILYGPEERQPARPEIYLKDLMVSYRAPEVAFGAE